MDKAYRIRGAVAGDLERIVALDREIDTLPHWGFADYLAALPPLNRDAGSGGTRRCLFVAESKSPCIVGFAVGKVTAVETETHAELESVGVAEPARRLGTGRALCAAVIEWSRRQGATEIDLEVRGQSSGAIALYEELGFASVGRRAGYYRDPVDDAILMRLDLSANSAQDGSRLRDL